MKRGLLKKQQNVAVIESSHSCGGDCCLLTGNSSNSSSSVKRKPKKFQRKFMEEIMGYGGDGEMKMRTGGPDYSKNSRDQLSLKG
jgi:hypothetical protein